MERQQNTRSRLWIVVVCVLSAASLSSGAQRHEFQEPVPEKTVDPMISPLVYEGGTVVLRVSVAADGSVSAIDAIKTVPALTAPVIAAVRQWLFKPASLDGRPVEATTNVAVHIVLVRK